MKRAFTLLELLIVISIMFVLLSIYMGRVYSRAMEAGRLTQCSSNLRQLFIAAEIYVDLTGTTPIWDEYPDDADRRRQQGREAQTAPDALHRRQVTTPRPDAPDHDAGELAHARGQVDVHRMPP